MIRKSPNPTEPSNSAPDNNNETIGELSEKAREKYQKLGAKVYDLTSVELDEESIKKNARFLAAEAVKADEANRKEAFRANHSKLAKLSENKIIGFAAGAITSIPVGIANSIRSAYKSNEYKKIAQTAIKDTGKMSAGSMVIDQLRKTKSYNSGMLSDEEKASGVLSKSEILEKAKDNVKNIDQSVDEAVKVRAEEAMKAGDDNIDSGVKVEKSASEDLIKDLLKDYAVTVASAKDNKKRERLKIELARRKMEEGFKEFGEDYSKYGDTIKEMTDDLRGKLSTELAQGKKSEEHKAAIEAIDEYISKNVNVLDVKVDTGLAVDDVYGSTSMKAALKYGAAVGAIVGIGSTCVGYMKNSVISSITNSTIIGTCAKMALAGGIGAVKGYNTKERQQRSKNIENALNIDGENTNIDKKKEINVISVDKKIAEMQSIEFKDGKIVKKNEDGTYSELKKYAVADIICELRARNELQNEYSGSKKFKKGVQLLGYNGRENVEKSKMEMFKELNRLQRGLYDIDESMREEIESGVISKRGEIGGAMMTVRAEQGKERGKAALKTGLVAASVAGVASFAFDYVKGAFKNDKMFSADNSKLLSEIKGLRDGDLKWQGLHVVSATEAAGAAIAADAAAEAIEDAGAESQEVLKEYKGALIINDDPQGGSEIGFDADGDGKIDTFLHGEGSEQGLNLTDDKVYENLSAELKEYGIELDRETITSSAYNEVNIGDYLNDQENAVEVNGVDWSNSATKVSFGKPVAISGDGMDQYEVAIKGLNGGEIPDGAKFFIDLDGDGPGKALEFSIEDGKAIIPADVLDTSAVGDGGAAQFIGTARVGELNNGTMISYATSVGKKATLDSMISASVSENAYAFTAVDMESGERISQFAVNSANKEISNLSEIFNGIQVGDSDRLPSTFAVHDLDGDTSTITLASGESFEDYDVSGGYHPEFDAFENKPFIEGKSYLGTPMVWDADGDGIMSADEELSYIKQMFVRTGTNPFMLAQNASNYGILEPERLRTIFANDYEYDKFLEACGITDGVIDSEAELNTMIEALKSNPEYWDKIANETINEMEKQLQGGGFEVGTVTDRLSTYANSNELFDTSNASTMRTALYPYHVNEDGAKEYVGNQGWWCRKYGAEGGKVGDMPRCEQKCITRGKTGAEKTSSEKTGGEKTSGEKISGEKTGSEKTTDEKTGSEKITDEKTGGEKTTDEKTGGEKNTDEKTSNENIAPKGPDTHAGDDVAPAPTTPIKDNTDYQEATPDNHVEPEPGSSSDANPDSGNRNNTNYTNKELGEMTY